VQALPVLEQAYTYNRARIHLYQSKQFLVSANAQQNDLVPLLWFSLTLPAPLNKQASKQLFTGQQKSSAEHPGDI
jgi:hypothetical protein